VPAVGLLGLAAVAIATVLWARFERATLVVLLGLMVLPTTLPLPLGPRWLAVSRILLWACALGLLRRVKTGEVDFDCLRPSRVHAALLGFLVCAFLIGVVLIEQPAPRFESGLIWLTLADQGVVLVVVLAAARHLGPWRVARLVVLLGGAIGAIGVSERMLGANWNSFFFEAVGRGFAAGSRSLEQRGGVTRVRGPSQFALELGWVTATLVPMALLMAAHLRGLVWRLAPVALALASVWSVSRSATAGLAVGVVVLVLAARDSSVTRLVIGATAVAGVAFLLVGSLSSPFDGADADSEESRYRRFAFVAGEVSDRPLVGLGLAGPRALSVLGTDTSYVLFYATIGVVGLCLFLVVLGTALLSVATSLRGPPVTERLVGAGALAGMATMAVGTAFFDAFTVPGASRLFWVLTAIGLACADRAPSDTPPLGPVRGRELLLRATIPAAGLLLGTVVATVTPAHTTYTAAFDVVGPRLANELTREPTYIGRVLITTTCDALRGLGSDGVAVECREPRRAATVGELRVEGRDARSVRRKVEEVHERLSTYLPTLRVAPVGGFTRATPTWASTAPVSLGLLGLAVGMLVPMRRGRRPDRDPDGPEPRPKQRVSAVDSTSERGLAERDPSSS